MESNQHVTFGDIQDFSAKYWLKIALRGVVSLGVLLVVLALAFAATPRCPTYDREILITLQEKAGHAQYPNGKPFSFTDIVAPAVLEKVYRVNGLEQTVKFDDFCDLVKVGGIDCERAKIDAEYRAKLNKRNLTSADAVAIERAYNEAVAALPKNLFNVRFLAPSGISKVQAAQIADAIPGAWFEIASTLEAETFPILPRAAAISRMKADLGKTSALAQVEQIKMYIGQLQAVANFLTAYGQNRNFTLPSGETVRDVQNDLSMLMTYDVNLLQCALSGNATAGSVDEAFVNGNLLAVDKRLSATTAKCSAIAAAISRMEGGRAAGSAKMDKDTGALMLDGAFFHEYAQLIRNDMNNKLRSSLVERSLEAEEERGDLEASKSYYEQLRAQMKAAKSAIGPQIAGGNVKMASVVDSVASAAEKLATFRVMITKDHLTSRRFYVPTGSVKHANNFAWPFARIVLGLAAIWALYNLVFLVGLWNARKE